MCGVFCFGLSGISESLKKKIVTLLFRTIIFSFTELISYFCNLIYKFKIMATASLKIRLSYNQILELARQLSDEDKLQLNRELSAEVRKIELQRLLQVFKNDEISLEEISSEVELVRQARYEARK